MSERAVIGFPDWTQEVVFAGGGWQAAYPLSNLSNLPLSRVARSLDLNLTNTQIEITLPNIRPVQLLGLAGHNMTTAAQYRLRIWDDNPDLVYDSGWEDVWPTVYETQYRDFHTPNWFTGRYVDSEIQGQYSSRPFWLPERVVAKTILLEFADADNPAGHVQAGYLAIAEAWQVSLNPSYGSSVFGLEFNDIINKSEGSTLYIDERPKVRQFRGEIEHLELRELKQRAYELMRQHGQKKPFFWLPDPADTLNWVRDSYLARLENPGLLKHTSHDAGSFPFNFREAI